MTSTAQHLAGVVGQGDTTVGIPPVEPATVPAKRPPARGRRFLRGLRTFLVVVLLLGAAGYGGVTVVRHRLATASYVSLGDAVLSAQAVPVGSPDAATVNAVLVTEQSRVEAGQALARVTVPALGPGQPAQTRTLRAPVAGVIAKVNVSVGSVAQPGQAVITLYSQDKLTFQADVPVERLRKLRLGMTAYVSGPGLGHRITTRLDHVVPRVGAGPGGAAELTVVLVPLAAERATVGTLVPGLPFQATVDIRTAVGGTPVVNSAG